jgi:uncharacterized protein YllA (UPF0747 family)
MQLLKKGKNLQSTGLLLVEELRKQYEGITLTTKQEENLQLLSSDNTFTICTAHQPVIFTGPLYFIYKIIHAIKLADTLHAVNLVISLFLFFIWVVKMLILMNLDI